MTALHDAARDGNVEVTRLFIDKGVNIQAEDYVSNRICISVCLPVCLSVCLRVYLPVSLCACLCVCVCMCMCVRCMYIHVCTCIMFLQLLSLL